MDNQFIGSLSEALSILEHAFEGILVVEIETRAIRYANPAICAMFGYSFSEFLALSVHDIHPVELLQAVMDEFETLTRGDRRSADVIPCRKKDGTAFLAHISSSRIVINGLACSVGFFTDVTERKRNDEAIYKSEKQFRTLFMSMSDGFYLSEVLYDVNGNPCDYRYLEVNPKFEEIAGLRRDQIVGRRYREIVPVDTTRWLEVYCMVARTGKPMSYEFYSAQYQMYFETYSYQPAQGQVSVIVRDVTARKKTEEALYNTQKLESLGVMAGGIAHDFNNLLAGIYGYIDLANCEPDRSRSSEYLSKALDTIERTRALTGQLLTFSKGGEPVLKTGSLFPFLEESVRFALSGANVLCHFDVQQDLWACSFDRNQIGQVFDNLVINAQQAMPLGGTIVLAACNVVMAENEHPLLKKGNYVRLSVVDTGIGIPREIHKRIFDPFFTTKNKGHGLGLATCYSIVSRHGGCIDVFSEPGKGSTFHVYLPAASGTVTERGAARAKTHHGRGVFLVMDDEKVIRETVSSMLAAFGYTVVCTVNGQEAVEYVASSVRANQAIAGMLFDLTVPGAMGGGEAIVQIRAMGVDAPAFASSGYANDPVIRDPAKYGFTASISKPFMRPELAEMLEAHIQGPDAP